MTIRNDRNCILEATVSSDFLCFPSAFLWPWENSNWRKRVALLYLFSDISYLWRILIWWFWIQFDIRYDRLLLNIPLYSHLKTNKVKKPHSNYKVRLYVYIHIYVLTFSSLEWLMLICSNYRFIQYTKC